MCAGARRVSCGTLREESGKPFTVTIVRGELRRRLSESEEAQAVGALVAAIVHGD